MKRMLCLVAALAVALPWAARAQSGGYGYGYEDGYPGADAGEPAYGGDPYVGEPAYGDSYEDAYRGEPAYGEYAYTGEPAHADDGGQGYGDEPAYADSDGRDARCDYGCAHYHWEEADRYGYD